MSERIGQVVVGQHEVGDIVHGHRVTGFGRAWTLQDEDLCAVGYAPGSTVLVCYAYGEPAAPEAAAATNPADARIAQMRADLDRLEAIDIYSAGSTRKYNAIREQARRLEQEIETLTARAS